MRERHHPAIARKWLTLLATTGSLCMILLDTTVVGVALPAIQGDLSLTPIQLQWVVNAYVLVLASCVAMGGRAADAFGRVRVFLSGVALFAISSAWCGFATSSTHLLVARALQGLGAAIMQPASASLVVNSFAPGERGKAMAVYAGIPLLFMSAGPVIGGAITEYASWRWNFWLNIPIAAASIALLCVARPMDDRAPKRGNDLVGALLLLASLPPLVWGIMEGGGLGWTRPEIALSIGSGVILLPVFVWWERRHPTPLLMLGLFSNPAIAMNAIILFATQFAMTGLVIYGSIYAQRVLLFDPLGAGASLLPMLAPILVVIHVAGRMYDRVGVRVPAMIGTSLAVVGMAIQAVAAALANYPLLAIGMLFLGTGIGFVMSPVNTDSMSRVPANQRGQLSGLMQTFRMVGGSLGVAVVGGAILLTQQSALEQRLKQVEPGASMSPLEIEREVLANSVSTGWWICTATLLGAFIASSRLRPIPNG